MVLDIAQ